MLVADFQFERFVQPDDDEIVKWCPRCRLIREQTSEAGYCLRCGTAMLDRFCIVCREPLFGPDLMHLTTMIKGGPRTI